MVPVFQVMSLWIPSWWRVKMEKAHERIITIEHLVCIGKSWERYSTSLRLRQPWGSLKVSPWKIVQVVATWANLVLFWEELLCSWASEFYSPLSLDMWELGVVWKVFAFHNVNLGPSIVLIILWVFASLPDFFWACRLESKGFPRAFGIALQESGWKDFVYFCKNILHPALNYSRR